MCRFNGNKCVLVSLLALYTISNLVFMVSSIVARKKVAAETEDDSCSIRGIHCGTSLWALFALQEVASMINFGTSFNMLLGCMLRGKGSQLDPLYVFRGVFFTLIVLAPVFYFGWAETTQIEPAAGLSSQFVGIKGGFILHQLLDPPGTTAAVALAHINFFFGAMICGLAAAMAPPAGLIVGVHGIEPVVDGTA